jgi:hypothetical protein
MMSAEPIWVTIARRYLGVHEGVGQPLKGPALGAIATKVRDGGGHVFFVVGWDATRVYGLGGNQSDQVSIAAFPRNVIHSYTWPPGVPLPGPQPQKVAIAKAAAAGGSEA